MFKYLNNFFNYMSSFLSNEPEEPRFEKPRGYKNISSNEAIKLNRQ